MCLSGPSFSKIFLVLTPPISPKFFISFSGKYVKFISSKPGSFPKRTEIERAQSAGATGPLAFARFKALVAILFETEIVLPAAGQGIIAVQCKKNDDVTKNFLKNINDLETELCAKAERKMLQVIGGNCKTAVGGLAVIENKKLKLKAQLFSDSGSNSFEYELSGSDIDAINIGKAVGKKLLSLAGKEFKKE